MTEADTLDLRGLKCPLPALMARRHLAATTPGTPILVIADDPMAAVDIPFMCHAEGFEVLQTERDGALTRFLLRRP